MKTLNTIQGLAKIGRILSKIIFIFCIVGSCGCAVGIVSLAVGVEVFKLGGVTIRGLIENSAGMSGPVMYAAMACGMVFCVSEAVLCKFSEVYFRNELADGTPFTLRGAKELLRLGILAIAIPLGAEIVCAAGVAAAGVVCPGMDNLPFGEFSSVGLGVMLIVLSLFCRYGVELREGKPGIGREQS